MSLRSSVSSSPPAELVAAVDDELQTDYAILSLSQERVMEDGSQSFVTSAPGTVSALCGTKYATAHVRVERWSARPAPLDGWEDFDELPFADVADAGQLRISGFDPGERSLDITGLGPARVQAFASGRHRYSYSDHPEEDLPPEAWLFRIFPQGGDPDPMAGGPRRIAGEGGLGNRPSHSPWVTAVLGWRDLGWNRALVASQSFYQANLALLGMSVPATRSQLAARIARWMPPYTIPEDGAEQLLVPTRSEPDPIMTMTGRSEPPTIADVIDALIDLGLIAIERRDGCELFLPNPAPQAAWVRLGLRGEELLVARRWALYDRTHGPSGDLVSALRWAGPAGLTASTRTMAVRWAHPLERMRDAVLLNADSVVDSARPIDLDSPPDLDEPLRMVGRKFR